MIRIRWWGPLAGVGGAFLVGALALHLGGYDPIRAFGALWRGGFGSFVVFTSATLPRAVPLLLTGLAVALAFRAGIWNIGAEGQLHAGAVAGVSVALFGAGLPAPVLLPAVLLAGVAAGALWVALPAWMRLRGTNEVITTLLLNFVAIQLTAWLVHGPLQEARGVFSQTDRIPAEARLPLLLPGSAAHAGILLALACALGLWALFRFTRVGFLIRALGEGAEAARVTARIETDRLGVGVFLASGAFAGVAGAVQVSGVDHALYENLSPGWGYTAIAVALLARLRPGWVVASALFFAALQAGGAQMQREAGIPPAWVSVIEALTILGVILAARPAPAREGAPDPGSDPELDPGTPPGPPGEGAPSPGGTP